MLGGWAFFISLKSLSWEVTRPKTTESKVYKPEATSTVPSTPFIWSKAFSICQHPDYDLLRILRRVQFKSFLQVYTISFRSIKHKSQDIEKLYSKTTSFDVNLKSGNLRRTFLQLCLLFGPALLIPIWERERESEWERASECVSP